MSKKCVYCGNNQIPHFFAWYFESLGVFSNFVMLKFSHWGFVKWLEKIAEKLKIIEKIVKLLLFLKILKENKDVTKCKVRRAQVLWEEAEKRGMQMSELILIDKTIDSYFLTYKNSQRESKTILFAGLPRPENFFSPNFEIMDDKASLKKIFKQAGLPVPAGGVAYTFAQARKIFETIQNGKQIPVIVKPRLGSRGRHTTTFVRTLEDLKSAYDCAKQLCFWVMIEQQIQGPVYRATLINFQLGGVLKGEAPFVVGDGRTNLAGLVFQKNSTKLEKVKDIILNSESEMYLQRQGMTASYIPKVGEEVFLSAKIGISYGGSSSEDFEICHPDNKKLFLTAAKVLGDPIVGFDFIIPDITKSYKEQFCGFIEANSLPFINLHHDPLLGKPRNVASLVLDMAVS